MRILFVVPPLAGHALPTVAVADELRRGGHDVAWATYRNLVAPVLPDWAEVIAVGPDVDRTFVDEVSVRAASMRGFAALKFLYDDLFLPLARDMAPGIERVVESYRPDVIVADTHAFAGAAVARRRAVPHVTSASTWAEFTGQLAAFPKVVRGLHDSLVQLQLDLGVPEAIAHRGDLRVSDDLTLVYTDEALAGPLRPPWDDTGPLHPVGPVLPRPDSGDWRWREAYLPDEALTETPLVLVTMGTVYGVAAESFLSRVVDAARELPARVIVTAAAPVAGPVPANVTFVPRVPSLALLSHVDAVLCHGGAGTVSESLSFGVPLVVAPIRDDQPVVAAAVERVGAGRRVSHARCTPGDIAAAVQAVLQDATYRDAAQRVAKAFAAAGGAPAAAALIVELAR